MNRVNPSFILTNFILEEAIQAAEKGDFTPVKTLLEKSKKPFDQEL